MFQTFVRNRYNLVRYKTFGEKVEAMKMTKNIMTLLLAGLVEAYIGYIIAKKLWKSKKERSRASVLGQTLTSFVPTIGNVINTDMYGNVVIDPLNVPSLDSLGQGLTTLKKTGKVIQGKESVSKYLGTLLSTFGPVFGLPSSVPLGRAIKTY